jgi:hypothetical protein
MLAPRQPSPPVSRNRRSLPQSAPRSCVRDILRPGSPRQALSASALSMELCPRASDLSPGAPCPARPALRRALPGILHRSSRHHRARAPSMEGVAPAILAPLPATRGARYYSAFSTSASAVPAWPAAVAVAMLEADPAPHPNIFLKSSDPPPSSAACVASSIYSPARYLAQNPVES